MCLGKVVQSYFLNHIKYVEKKPIWNQIDYSNSLSGNTLNIIYFCSDETFYKKHFYVSYKLQ